MTSIGRLQMMWGSAFEPEVPRSRFGVYQTLANSNLTVVLSERVHGKAIQGNIETEQEKRLDVLDKSGKECCKSAPQETLQMSRTNARHISTL